MRNSTGNYLIDLVTKGVFPQKINARILTVGKHYRDAYMQWKKLYDILGHHVDETTKSSKEQRMKGADIINLPLKHEKEVLEIVKAIL